MTPSAVAASSAAGFDFHDDAELIMHRIHMVGDPLSPLLAEENRPADATFHGLVELHRVPCQPREPTGRKSRSSTGCTVENA